MVRRLFLHGVLGHHIQLLRHLVAVIALEIVIERLAVTGYRTTDTGSMGGEKRGDLRTMILQIEDRERRLPLVCMHAELPFRQELIEALHDDAGSITEETGLIVVAISGMTLHLEFIPSPGVDLILMRPKGVELQQDSDRLTGNLPTTYADRKRSFPCFQEFLVFLEIDITMVAEVRAEEEHFVRMLGLHGSGTRREHGIDTAYTVAYFPRGFKNIIRLSHL